MVKRFEPKGRDAILNAAKRMAKSIKDPAKAYRRGAAAEDVGYDDVRDIFFEKAETLTDQRFAA